MPPSLPLCHHGGVSEPRLVMVLSPYQNVFFHEIAEVIVDELTGAGVEVATTTEPGAHGVRPDDVFVLMPPHEYVAIEGSAFVDDPIVAARTIGISAEQPHQGFFTRNAEIGSRLGAVLDFSRLSVDAYHGLGMRATHLPFGYTARWDRYRPGHLSPGPPRVLYLGNKRPRRLGRLAEAAHVLAREHAQLLISDNESPNLATGPSFVAGDDKRDLLAGARLLVNIHQGDEPYFEWLRIAEAAHCGTPVLSERSVHTDPFVPGVHFAEFDDHGLAHAIELLIDDDRRLAELGAAAYERLRQRPLSASVDILVDAARSLLAAAPPASLPGRTRTSPLGVERLVELPHVAGRGHRPLSRWRRTRPASVTVIATDAGDLVSALTAWSPRSADITVHDPAAVDAALARRIDSELVLIAPSGTTPRGAAFERLLDAVSTGGAGAGPVTCWSAIVDGSDADGMPTLEGIWPWQPWRLRRGQHLGRLVVAPAGVVRAAAPWFEHPELRLHPHLVVQAWVATHGGVGGHVSTPVATVGGSSLDPTQCVPDAVLHQLLALVESER